MAYNSIIIPSKHIYGKPKFTTPNNDINTVYVDESKFNLVFSQIYSATNVSSNQVYSATYYGEWFVDMARRTRWELECTYNQFVINVKTENLIEYDTLESIIYINSSGNVSDVGNYQNQQINLQRMSLSSFDYTINNIPQTPPATSDILLIAKFCNEQILSKNGYEIEIISPYEFNCTIKFLKSIRTYMGEELQGSDLSWGEYSRQTTAYNPQIDNLNIEINASCISGEAESVTKQYGTKPDVLTINSNELMQEETKTTKLAYNLIYAWSPADNILSRNLYVLSAYPVKSDITVVVRTGVFGLSYHTFIIEKDTMKSTTTEEIGFYEPIYGIESVIPIEDEYYYYNEALINDDSRFVSISNYIANNIIQNYTNGKKTMSLEAGYGDYYYADGTPYGGVAGKKMLLQVGDIVQPMRWDGSKDVPYSLDIYGNSRVFEITSAELNVGGAPKLYLELLEKTT